MFDLSFYEMIKWALNVNEYSNDLKHKGKSARRIALEDVKYNDFMLLVLVLCMEDENTLINLSIYVEDFLEYFIK